MKTSVMEKRHRKRKTEEVNKRSTSMLGTKASFYQHSEAISWKYGWLRHYYPTCSMSCFGRELQDKLRVVG